MKKQNNTIPDDLKDVFEPEAKLLKQSSHLPDNDHSWYDNSKYNTPEDQLTAWLTSLQSKPAIAVFIDMDIMSHMTPQ
jgi:hypothetical protein